MIETLTHSAAVDAINTLCDAGVSYPDAAAALRSMSADSAQALQTTLKAKHAPRYAFMIEGSAKGNVLPIVNGEPARTPLSRGQARRQGYTCLPWPSDPVGPVAAVDLPDYLPEAPDPATATRVERLAALAACPEAADVDDAVLSDLAASNAPVADCRAFMRGLTPSAIRSQFSLSNPKEDSAMTEANTPAVTPRDKRLAELRENVSPTRAGHTARVVDGLTAEQREHLVSIRVNGIKTRVESGCARPGDKAKLREIESAEVLARANSVPLVHALAVMGVTLT
jgi:hypothetical protein